MYLGRDVRKPIIGGLRTTKAQTSLRIRTVWSAPSLFAYYKVSYIDFPIGILGQVWYLIVSIPDLCTLTYFAKSKISIF